MTLSLLILINHKLLLYHCRFSSQFNETNVSYSFNSVQNDSFSVVLIVRVLPFDAYFISYELLVEPIPGFELM